MGLLKHTLTFFGTLFTVAGGAFMFAPADTVPAVYGNAMKAGSAYAWTRSGTFEMAFGALLVMSRSWGAEERFKIGVVALLTSTVLVCFCFWMRTAMFSTTERIHDHTAANQLLSAANFSVMVDRVPADCEHAELRLKAYDSRIAHQLKVARREESRARFGLVSRDIELVAVERRVVDVSRGVAN